MTEPEREGQSIMPNSETILDHPIVSSRYFFPRREPLSEPYWIEAADGSTLACYYQAVHPAAKTVVYFHGNGEVVSDYLPDFPQWITRARCNVLLAEYRGYGMSTGRPALAGMLEDVLPIIESLNVPDNKIVLFGRSLGSLYALHGVYRRPQIGGLIIESGVADLTERFFQRVAPEELGLSKADIENELRNSFDYVRKLESFQGQTLILHARFDELLDAHHAGMLYAAAPEPKQLKIFDQGGHNDIFFRNRAEYMQLVETFLATV
jgi:pimeloyl-ACP methyl ester carboxylesterase